jgi:hypothetical protein
VLLVAVVDIIALEFNQKEFIVWSPVWANILMLIGLAWIYHKRIEKIVLNDNIRKKFAVLIGLNVLLSLTSNIPSIIYDTTRFALVFYSLFEIWKMMKLLNLKDVIISRNT